MVDIAYYKEKITSSRCLLLIISKFVLVIYVLNAITIIYKFTLLMEMV